MQIAAFLVVVGGIAWLVSRGAGAMPFNGARWAAPHPDIHIYDQQFVAENIH